MLIMTINHELYIKLKLKMDYVMITSSSVGHAPNIHRALIW